MPPLPPSPTPRRATRMRQVVYATAAAVALGLAVAVDIAAGSPGAVLVQLPIIALAAVVLHALQPHLAPATTGRWSASARCGAPPPRSSPPPTATRSSPPAWPPCPSSRARSARAAITVADGHRVIVKGEAGPDPLRLPLRGREPQGVLAVSAPGGLDADARGALESLAGELGMALEAAGLSAQLARRDADAWYRSMIDNASDVITVLERDGTIRYQSPSIEGVIGFPPEALAGTSALDVLHPDDREWAAAQYRRVLERPGPSDRTVLVRWRHRDGGYRHVENRHANLLDDPAVGGVVVNSRDVTDRVALEEQLTHRAFHDALTGLANRVALRRPPRACALRGQPAGRAARGPVHRPRRLQEGQRLARPPDRRRAAAGRARAG